MAPASKGTLLNIHYYYYYYIEFHLLAIALFVYLRISKSDRRESIYGHTLITRNNDLIMTNL